VGPGNERFLKSVLRSAYLPGSVFRLSVRCAASVESVEQSENGAMQAPITSPNPASLPPMSMITASILFLVPGKLTGPVLANQFSSCFSCGVTATLLTWLSAPGYVSLSMFAILAPEHAKDWWITLMRGNWLERSLATCGPVAFSDRWHASTSGWLGGCWLQT